MSPWDGSPWNPLRLPCALCSRPVPFNDLTWVPVYMFRKAIQWLIQCDDLKFRCPGAGLCPKPALWTRGEFFHEFYFKFLQRFFWKYVHSTWSCSRNFSWRYFRNPSCRSRYLTWNSSSSFFGNAFCYSSWDLSWNSCRNPSDNCFMGFPWSFFRMFVFFRNVSRSCSRGSMILFYRYCSMSFSGNSLTRLPYSSWNSIWSSCRGFSRILPGFCLRISPKKIPGIDPGRFQDIPSMFI